MIGTSDPSDNSCPSCVFVFFILRNLLPLIMRNLKGILANEGPSFSLLLLVLVLVQLENGAGSLAVCLTVPVEEKEDSPDPQKLEHF